MKILCGTDFSDTATAAARAAAQLAKRGGTELQLVHVARDAELDRWRAQLHALAQRLRESGCKVAEHVLQGPADEALADQARTLGCELLVIGPYGEHGHAAWRLGSLAMRLIKRSHAPVLIVRDERPIAEWASAGRTLRVLIGLDRSATSRAALAWSRELLRLGKLEVVAAHVYSPAEAKQRYALGGESDPQRDAQRVERAVGAEMHALLSSAADLAPRVKLLAGWGRVSHHLLDVTDGERADLLVVGTHRRQGLERVWRGSVSLDLAAHAKCNVLTVPSVEAERRPQVEARDIRRVLVPCDLSDTSGRAVAWACALLARGGTLHLLHVSVPPIALAPDFGGVAPIPPPTTEEIARQNAEIERRLRELVPADATAREIETQLEITTAFDAATSIVQAAAKLDVDAICLTTHGRSGLSRALMGSVAEHVLRHAHVPVLVLTPRRAAASSTS